MILDTKQIEDVKKSVKGDLLDISQLSELTDSDEIKKVYKIKDAELLVGTLLDAVVNRISCKEFVIL